MTQNEIIEGNKLIADFMGIRSGVSSVTDFTVTPTYKAIEPCYKPVGEIMSILARGLKYHTSWDWLMPVVEKIEGLPFIEGWCTAGRNKIELHWDISNVYPQVVEFITYQNTAI